MPHISSIERRALEKGREEGRAALIDAIATCLKTRFPDECADILPKVQTIAELQSLRAVLDALFVDDLDEVRRSLPD